MKSFRHLRLETLQTQRCKLKGREAKPKIRSLSSCLCVSSKHIHNRVKKAVQSAYWKYYWPSDIIAKKEQQRCPPNCCLYSSALSLIIWRQVELKGHTCLSVRFHSLIIRVCIYIEGRSTSKAPPCFDRRPECLCGKTWDQERHPETGINMSLICYIIRNHCHLNEGSLRRKHHLLFIKSNCGHCLAVKVTSCHGGAHANFSPHLLVTVLSVQYTTRGSHLGAIQISPSSWRTWVIGSAHHCVIYLDCSCHKEDKWEILLRAGSLQPRLRTTEPAAPDTMEGNRPESLPSPAGSDR